MTIKQFVGGLFILSGFIYIATLRCRSREMWKIMRREICLRQEICSCHTPIRWALRRYLSIFSVLLLVSGCATKGDIKRIESWARHDAKMSALDSAAIGERINQALDRIKTIEAERGQAIYDRDALSTRVRYLEKVVAPNDPDGLLEDPDLYRNDSERKRFYCLWERTERGE